MSSEEVFAMLHPLPNRPGRWAYVRASDDHPIVYWLNHMDYGFGPILQVTGADDLSDWPMPDTHPEDLSEVDSETGNPLGTWGVRLGDLP